MAEKVEIIIGSGCAVETCYTLLAALSSHFRFLSCFTIPIVFVIGIQCAVCEVREGEFKGESEGFGKGRMGCGNRWKLSISLFC